MYGLCKKTSKKPLKRKTVHLQYICTIKCHSANFENSVQGCNKCEKRVVCNANGRERISKKCNAPYCTIAKSDSNYVIVDHFLHSFWSSRHGLSLFEYFNNLWLKTRYIGQRH